MTATIRYYCRMANTTKGKTPRYTIVQEAGYFEPMQYLKGRDGRISMYLVEKLREGDHVPAMRLQAKGSLNFTGLKEYFTNGKLSEYAYGYPDARPTYSSNNKPNPFYPYKDDGFLFVVHSDKSDKDNLTPTAIEMIVLSGAKVVVGAYCKQLAAGGFDEELQALRKQGQSV